MQGLAEEIYNVVGKAKVLQQLWAGGSKRPGKSISNCLPLTQTPG